MLNRLKSPTKPPAPTGPMEPLNNSWIIGDACSKIPISAVTLAHSTTHWSQNGGVLNAVFTSSLWVVTSFCSLIGAVHFSGFHFSQRKKNQKGEGPARPDRWCSCADQSLSEAVHCSTPKSASARLSQNFSRNMATECPIRRHGPHVSSA
jgi:hypothetical protein